jgi:hypothetical protein
VAIVDGIPAPGRVIGDGPIDGHETGRDALALPMEPEPNRTPRCGPATGAQVARSAEMVFEMCHAITHRVNMYVCIYIYIFIYTTRGENLRRFHAMATPRRPRRSKTQLVSFDIP